MGSEMCIRDRNLTVLRKQLNVRRSESLKINLNGTAKRMELALEFEDNIHSNKNWLVAIIANNGDSRVSTTDLNWYYSAKFDVNFTYLVKSLEARIVSLPEIASTVPFDSIEIELIAWSGYALDFDTVPVLKRCVYSVSSQIIDGGEVKAVTSTIGIAIGKV